MITDEDLQALVASVAAEAPDPDDLPDDLFDAVPARASRVPRRTVVLAIGVAAAAFVVVLVAAALSTRRDSTTSTAVGDRSFSSVANSINGAAGTGTAVVTAGGGAGTGTAGGTAGGGAGTGPIEAQPIIPAQVPPITDTAKVIKTGSVEVGVGKGAVTESLNRLTALATGLGGYVFETHTTSNTAAGTQGSANVALRVPAGAFEQLLTEASKLGEVRSTTTSGQDVTAQFTDIDAQLTALGATRERLLAVLGEAGNVGDILAVQDRITQVQIQIDQLEGQKRLLTAQTSFATLTVTLLEPGATAAVVPAPSDDRDLGDAWSDARENFGNAIEAIVEASGTIAVVALCAAVVLGAAFLVYRAARRRLLTL